MSPEEILLRLGAATGAGLLLGLDRELRGISAGLRTHAMICMSSAMITVSALLLYYEFEPEGATIDPLRVIQGLAQAVGFVAAGAIFVAGRQVHNLTSAANIWLAAAVGIAAGAGQWLIVGAGVGFGVFILTLIRFVEHFLPRTALSPEEDGDRGHRRPPDRESRSTGAAREARPRESRD